MKIAENGLIIRTDSAGHVHWNRLLIGDSDVRIRRVLEMDNGDIVVGGNTTAGSIGAFGEPDMFIARLTADGLLLWSHNLGGEAWDELEDLLVTPDGQLLLFGSTMSYGDSTAVPSLHLLLVTNDGNLDWSRTYSTPNATKGKKLIQATDGGYFLIAETQTTDDVPYAQIIKVDSNGDFIGESSIAAEGPVTPFDAYLGDDSVLHVGARFGEDSQSDYGLLTLDQSGSLMDYQRYGTEDEDKLSSISPGPDGGVLLGGNTQFGSLSSSIYLVKFDSELLAGPCNEVSDSLYTIETNLLSSAGSAIQPSSLILEMDSLSLTELNLTDSTLCVSECDVFADFLISDNQVCAGESVSLLNLSTNASDFQWLLEGVMVSMQEEPTIVLEAIGVQELTLVASTDACTDEKTIVVEVFESPDVSISSDTTARCVFDLSQELIGLPGGGEFSGQGVLGNMFDPSIAGPGVHWVKYSYTNSSGCSASDSIMMEVDICPGLNEEASNVLQIWPNPSNGILHLKVNTEVEELHIIDLSGRRIERLALKEARDGVQVIDLSSLARGSYLLTWTANELTGRKRFLIQR